MITSINEFRKYVEGFGTRIAIGDLEEDVQLKIKELLTTKYSHKLYGDNDAIKDAQLDLHTIYYEIPSLDVETDYSTIDLAKKLEIAPQELAKTISDILKSLTKRDVGLYEKVANKISGATALRKLTKKSTLKFGKWSDLTIGNLIKIEKPYLRWVYFNSSNIDFMDDVLTEIEIPTEFKISKPGKDEEKGKKLEQILKTAGTKKDTSFIGNLAGFNKNRIKSTMDNEEKLSSDNDVAYTKLKFGKLDGGKASKTQNKIK